MGFSNGGDTNRKKFTGYERDTETSLDFAQARFYSSGSGRFTSPDPFSASAQLANPQTFNRYSYCGNNPVVSTDPTGMTARGMMTPPSGERANQANASIDQANALNSGAEAGYAEMVHLAFMGIHENDSVTVTISENVPDSTPEESEAAAAASTGSGPQNSSQSCKDIVSLEGADTEGGAMSRVIFAESTGYEAMANTLYRSAGSDTSNIDIDTPYFNERYAVAASVYNRVNYLAGIQTPRDPLRVGSPGASVIDVIYSRGDVAGTQYQGFTTSRKGELTISGAVQGRITRALNSPADSSACYDLRNAVTVAKGAHYDPFGGRTFGLFSGTGSPGKAFYSLPPIPGSGNRFYGLNH